MKFQSTIKIKSMIIIIGSILFSTFATYNLLKEIYLISDEKQLESYITGILEDVGSDLEHIEESMDWTLENLNLTIYAHDNIEDLLALVPSNVDSVKVLSDEDIQQLRSGNTVINKIKTVDSSMDLLLFTHPVIVNNNIEKLLFMHLPSNNMEKSEELFASLTTILAVLLAGLALMVNKRVFKQSWSNFENIKSATIALSNGNLDAKIMENSGDEVGELTELFNAMSTNLKDEQIRVKEFMEDFSHEVKTPITLVTNYNRALMDNLLQTREDQHKCYQLIDREMNRMQKLVQNFLDFTKLDAQSVELVKQPIVFAQFVEDVMLKYELIFKEKKIKLDMALDYDVIISADEERLEQIIQNIVQNAIRYSKDDAFIRISMKQKEASCVLAIADNGVGISEEHLAVIINRFVRVNKVRSRKEGGTGLGLSIVEKLMELHGGKMVIESQLGVGTTIKLEFPVLSD